ncbi:MAG: hypothetical protein NZ954_02260 [Thermofilaceae archaeon]|nr:hypothetical protein [Thermofilaceae archaeon]MCX8180932.1 hypothetical protein [Thermofilaceae archaeon]
MRPSQLVSLVSLNAALYAALGYASYLGLFAPVIGVVRFWPSVFIPSTFAILFGETVGGLGAAIGIFISDLLIHGNVLLSLTVGVPANFLGFYTVGYLYKRLKDGRKWLAAVLFEEVLVLSLVVASYYFGYIDWSVALAYLIGMTVSMFFTLVYGGSRFPLITFACSTGLLIGSAVIGFGVYAFSQFFVLPSGASHLPLDAALIWFLWTYVTEIPFMVALVPPLTRAAERVLPRIKG